MSRTPIVVLNSVLKLCLVNAYVAFCATKQTLSVMRFLRSSVTVVGILYYLVNTFLTVWGQDFRTKLSGR